MTRKDRITAIWDDENVKKYDHEDAYSWLEENYLDEWNDLPEFYIDEDAWFEGVDCLVSKYFQGMGIGEFIIKTEYNEYIDKED